MNAPAAGIPDSGVCGRAYRCCCCCCCCWCCWCIDSGPGAGPSMMRSSDAAAPAAAAGPTAPAEENGWNVDGTMEGWGWCGGTIALPWPDGPYSTGDATAAKGNAPCGVTGMPPPKPPMPIIDGWYAGDDAGCMNGAPPGVDAGTNIGGARAVCGAAIDLTAATAACVGADAWPSGADAKGSCAPATPPATPLAAPPAAAALLPPTTPCFCRMMSEIWFSSCACCSPADADGVPVGAA